jgi:hypothetical protein
MLPRSQSRSSCDCRIPISVAVASRSSGGDPFTFHSSLNFPQTTLSFTRQVKSALIHRRSTCWTGRLVYGLCGEINGPQTNAGEEAMPRIAASLAVVIATAACMAFNTMRYPVVWEMVASAHRVPEGELVTAPAPSHPDWICTDGVCRPASPELPKPPTPAPPEQPSPPTSTLAASTAPPPSPAPRAEPERKIPAKPVALSSNRAGRPSARPEPPASHAGLVPVTRPTARPIAPAPSVPKASTPPAKPPTENAKGTRLAADMRRLPPPEHIWTPATSPQNQQPQEQIPIYPSTMAQ